MLSCPLPMLGLSGACHWWSLEGEVGQCPRKHHTQPTHADLTDVAKGSVKVAQLLAARRSPKPSPEQEHGEVVLAHRAVIELHGRRDRSRGGPRPRPASLVARHGIRRCSRRWRRLRVGRRGLCGRGQSASLRPRRACHLCHLRTGNGGWELRRRMWCRRHRAHRRRTLLAGCGVGGAGGCAVAILGARLHGEAVGRCLGGAGDWTKNATESSFGALC